MFAFKFRLKFKLAMKTPKPPEPPRLTPAQTKEMGLHLLVFAFLMACGGLIVALVAHHRQARLMQALLFKELMLRERLPDAC